MVKQLDQNTESVDRLQGYARGAQECQGRTLTSCLAGPSLHQSLEVQVLEP